MNVVDNEVKPVVDETCISLEGKTAPDGEEVMRKIDRESRFRKNMQGFWKYSLIVVSCIFIAYHLITSRFGMPPAFQHRAIHLGFILTLVWMYYPAGQKSITTRPSYIDMGLIVLTVGLTIFTYFNIDALALRAGRAVSADYIYGAFYLLLVLEACRRVSGPGLLALAIIFLLYAYLGPYMPGVLSHRGYSVHRLIYQMYLTTQGIFGQPIGIAATYLVLFIVFSNLLGKSGLGSLFNDLAMAIGGGLTGGPAKVAVLASALVGMINGSSATNVATSGAFTIPLMKRVGYKPYFAGAVEAAASTGGQIMPPIMGTVAFIMAEFLGISYLTIAGAALIPAILYFAAVFFQIDLRARKIGLQGVCREDMPSVSKALKTYGHMIIPIFVLIYLLFEGYTPIYAAFYSCVFTWVLSLFRKETRMGVKELVDLSVTSARACVSLSVAMANAGFVVGVLSMTGIGIILADNIVALSHGSLLITLFLTMVVSIILGMGLPTSACYIIAASIAVPILREMGVVSFLPICSFLLCVSFHSDASGCLIRLRWGRHGGGGYMKSDGLPCDYPCRFYRSLLFCVCAGDPFGYRDFSKHRLGRYHRPHRDGTTRGRDGGVFPYAASTLAQEPFPGVRGDVDDAWNTLGFYRFRCYHAAAVFLALCFARKNRRYRIKPVIRNNATKT